MTMIEVIAVVVILGIMSYMLVSNLPAVKRIGEEKEMKAKASQLNANMANFVMDQTLRQALTTWTGKTNEQRYTLLRPYLQYSADSLVALQVEGYEIVFPDDPRQKVILKDPDGKVLEYQ